MWPGMLAHAWAAGIVTVGAAGNVDSRNSLREQGNFDPPRFATADNAWITVGSVDGKGNKSPFNVVPGATSLVNYDQGLVGSMTVYAQGQDIPIAGRNSDTQYPDPRSGNSWSAAQVAGLAAYFLGHPKSVLPALGEIALAVKRHMVDLARDNSHDGEGIAYNGVFEDPCGAIGGGVTRRSLKESRAKKMASSGS